MNRHRKVAPIATVTPIVDVEKEQFSGDRKDGRSFNELRPIFLRTGVVHTATGSAYVEFGRTKVVCVVHGPRQKPDSAFHAVARLTCLYKHAPFADTVRGDQHESEEERELSGALAESLSAAVRLDRYPKSHIDVHALVLQSDGGAFAAAVVGCSLALADSGIEMTDLVSCAAAAVVNGTVALDPTAPEESHSGGGGGSGGGLSVAVLPSVGRVSRMVQGQAMPLEQSQQAIELCTEAAAAIGEMMQSALVAATQRRLARQQQQQQQQQQPQQQQAGDAMAV